MKYLLGVLLYYLVQVRKMSVESFLSPLPGQSWMFNQGSVIIIIFDVIYCVV